MEGTKPDFRFQYGRDRMISRKAKSRPHRVGNEQWALGPRRYEQIQFSKNLAENNAKFRKLAKVPVLHGGKRGVPGRRRQQVEANANLV